MTKDDYSYYHRRAREEDQAAQRATSAIARGLHEELADAYRFRCALARQLVPGLAPPQPGNQPNENRTPIIRARTAELDASPAIAARPFIRV